MSYRRTKFFSVQLSDPSDFGSVDFSTRTEMFDTRAQATAAVRDIATEGQYWLMLQTVTLLEATKPVVSMTTVEEYR